MRIKRVGIKNYKNIGFADIAFEGGINVLVGENANGKTNAVEAIYQFAQGKSFRTKNNADAISFGAEVCELSLDFAPDGADRHSNMKIQLKKSKADKNDKLKMFFCNGAQVKKIVEFIGNFRAVLFTPDHLGLVKGSPDMRRRFIDMAISQIKPVYLSYLIDCNRVLIQRNHLIKHIKQTGETGEKLEQLGIWTKKLAKYAAVITRYRGEYTERLKEYVPVFYSGLSRGREGIRFSYVSNINKYDREFCDFHDFEACENLYGEVLARGQKEELAAGTTLYGCQRDDLYIEIDGKSAREFASQGQQRSAVLSLKLAEGDISKVSHGEYPVFLLDDILSELDSSRQGFILKNLSNRQVLITCCSSELLGGDVDIAKTIRVENGRFF